MLLMESIRPPNIYPLEKDHFDQWQRFYRADHARAKTNIFRNYVKRKDMKLSVVRITLMVSGNRPWLQAMSCPPLSSMLHMHLVLAFMQSVQTAPPSFTYLYKEEAPAEIVIELQNCAGLERARSSNYSYDNPVQYSDIVSTSSRWEVKVKPSAKKPGS